MKILTSIIICLMSSSLYSQDQDYSLIYVYRDKDIYSNDKIAKIFLDDKLKIGLKGGCYDTIQIQNGCYNLKTNHSKVVQNICLQGNSRYFLINFKYKIIFGRFELIEVTESFAKNKIKDLKMDSLKK